MDDNNLATNVTEYLFAWVVFQIIWVPSMEHLYHCQVYFQITPLVTLRNFRVRLYLLLQKAGYFLLIEIEFCMFLFPWGKLVCSSNIDSLLLSVVCLVSPTF